MKNRKTNAGINLKMIAIIALAAVIGFSIAACGDAGDDDNGSNNNGGNDNGGGVTKNPVWTTINSPFSDLGGVKTLAWGNNRFVAGYKYGEMAYSSDGITWNAVADSKFGGYTLRTIAYGNGKFVAGGGELELLSLRSVSKLTYSSNDGVTWTAIADNDNPFITTWGYNRLVIHAIAYGNNKFIARGGGDIVAASTDGVTWTIVSNSTFGAVLFAIAYGGGKFVAVGGGGIINGRIEYSSDDGVTWNSAEDGAFGTNSINNIAYGGGKFVAVGDNGTIAYSSDGVTWTAAAVNPFYYPFQYGDNGYNIYEQVKSDIKAIAYGNGKFVAVNYGGKTATSTDGSTWTVKFETIFGGESVIGDGIEVIAFGGGKFVVMDSIEGKIAYWDGN